MALCAWTAILCWFFRDILFFGKALFYFDVTEINYPYRAFFARELAAGRFSRWCPDLYCGLALFSESQAGYLHPLKYVLYPWMETWRALNWDFVISIWLAWLGTYLWLRRHVGAIAAFGGASLFALSGYTWAHSMHTSMINALASVPFVIWSLEIAWESGKARAIVPGAIALACEVFAGHLQDALLTVALVGVYAGLKAASVAGARRKLAVLAPAAGIIALGVLLSSVQWIPSKELIDRSPRAGGLSYAELTYGSWSPELIPALAVREAYGTRARDTDWMDGFYPYHEMDVYMGLTGLGLAAIGARARRDRWVCVWLAIGIISLVLMLGKFTCIFDYANLLPVAGASREPVRFHVWAAMSVAALAAVGIERIARGGASLTPAVIVTAVIISISIPILVYDYLPVWTEPARWVKPQHIARYRWLAWELASASARTIVIVAIGWSLARSALSSASPQARRRRAAGLALLPALDLLSAHAADTPSIDPSYWTDPPPAAKVLKRTPGEIRVFGTARYSSGEPGYASEPVDFLPVRDTLDWSLPTVWGIKSSNGKTPIIPARMLRYTDNAKPFGGRFDLESVTHLVFPSPDAARTLGAPIKTGSAYLFRNPRALPRARLVGKPVYAADEHDAVKQLKRLGAQTLDHVIVEDPLRPLAEGSNARGTVAITRDDPETMVVAVTAETPGYLVVADTFDPGWSATVDGKPATIVPAYVAFRALYLGQGKHEVVFRYEPAGFRTGLALTILGCCLAALLIVVPIRRIASEDDHGALSWPARLPTWLALAALVLILGSAVGIDKQGRPKVHSRWREAFHRFTWGAGYEAMRPAPPPLE